MHRSSPHKQVAVFRDLLRMVHGHRNEALDICIWVQALLMFPKSVGLVQWLALRLQLAERSPHQYPGTSRNSPEDSLRIPPE
jgi:hypothetical protein